MMEITKISVIELPVIVISKHSALAPFKRSWSSTIKVAVKHTQQDDIIRHVDGRVQLEEDSALNVRDKGFLAGVMLLSPLSNDELYAKELIDMNGGIVEVGPGWPSGELKPKQLRIVWLDKPPLLGLDSKCKGQTTLPHPLQYMLLIGDPFVDALDAYHQQRWRLISSSVWPLHEQQVAHELKRLLVLIIKNLLKNRQFLDNLTQGCSEELVLVSIINILVDVQLYDDKNAANSKTLQLLLTNGDPAASEDYSRIVKHKVLGDLIAILQSVLAFSLPSKETVDSTWLGDMEKGEEAREKASYMQSAMFDVVVLLKHMWQAGNVLAETCIEEGVSTTLFKTEGINEVEGREHTHKDVQEQMLEIEWKMLLAVLGKKDPASFQNVLRNIHNEKQRQLLEMMAGPLGLEELTGGLSEESWTVGTLANTESGVQANIGAKKMQKMGGQEKKEENDNSASRGYYVKSDKKMAHQTRGNNSDQILQSGSVNQRQVPMEPDHLYQSTSSKELDCQWTSVQENASQCAPLQGDDCGVVKLLTEHADKSCTQGEGAGGQSQNQKHTHSTDKKDQESNPILDTSLHPDQPPANIDSHVINPAALSTSQAVYHDETDLVAKSPLWRDQLQTPLESHETDRAADDSQAATGPHNVNQAALEATGSHIVDQAALEAAAVDSHVPDHACMHVPSRGQATAYGGDDDDDDHYEDSKARRRKRKNRKPHRARENQELQHVPHCRMGPSRSSPSKIVPFVIVVVVLLVTIVGIIQFHSLASTNSNFGNKQCRAFAKGYLP